MKLIKAQEVRKLTSLRKFLKLTRFTKLLHNVILAVIILEERILLRTLGYHVGRWSKQLL